MNAIDALKEELRKTDAAGGDANAIWARARLDALLDEDGRAKRVQRLFAFAQLLAADGAIAALALPLGWHIALIAAMIVHLGGSTFAALREV